LELVAVIGIEDKLHESVKETVEMFQASKFNLWLMTGDCEENALATGYHSGILYDQSSETLLRIIAKNTDEAKVIIRAHLTTLK